MEPETRHPQAVRRVDFDPSDRVGDRARLEALQAALICDTPEEESFDRLTELIADLLEAPVALVSMVDADRQFFKSQHGLPEPVASERETPLSHSFCQYLVAADAPLVIDDARIDPTLATNGAVADLQVIAYAGFPIRGRGHEAIGSLCAIDTAARKWSDADLDLLERMADVVSDLIEVRTSAMVAEDRQATVEQIVESQERERTRIAAELHDDTLQVMGALSIRLQLLRRDVDADQQTQIDMLVEELGAANQRVRRFVRDLRPEALGHRRLEEVIAEHLDSLRPSNPASELTFSCEGIVEPAAPTALALFRIVQQAVGNALGHADPQHIDVSIRNVADGIEVTISDDGSGFDPTATPEPGHFGLLIMRERSTLVGGTLTVDSEPTRGTTIVATVPTGA